LSKISSVPLSSVSGNGLQRQCLQANPKIPFSGVSNAFRRMPLPQVSALPSGFSGRSPFFHVRIISNKNRFCLSQQVVLRGKNGSIVDIMYCESSSFVHGVTGLCKKSGLFAGAARLLERVVGGAPKRAADHPKNPLPRQFGEAKLPRERVFRRLSQ
jgi:hypothetical protein